jgi:hypothetical protein
LIDQTIKYKESPHDQGYDDRRNCCRKKEYGPDEIVEPEIVIVNYYGKEKTEQILEKNGEDNKDKCILQCPQVSRILQHIEIIVQTHEILKNAFAQTVPVIKGESDGEIHRIKHEEKDEAERREQPQIGIKNFYIRFHF